jgi:hypothetical protein
VFFLVLACLFCGRSFGRLLAFLLAGLWRAFGVFCGGGAGLICGELVGAFKGLGRALFRGA